MRVVVGEDDPITQEGIVRMLESAGIDVVAAVADATRLASMAEQQLPDVVLTDIRMPPTHTDDGLRAALAIRALHPTIGVLVLSQFLEEQYALDLVATGAAGTGYLLKEKVANAELLIDAVRRVAGGGSALDPDVIAQMVSRPRARGPLDDLTPREREVLSLMAEGHSNSGIAAKLFVTVPAVERHVTGIFMRLGLQQSESTQHRRVLAVLRYLDK
ncbi:MAG TPA: response regulator transcription factor [Microbacterium sp.]|nr:response regulator transcription factor [Microbacterium sp.]